MGYIQKEIFLSTTPILKINEKGEREIDKNPNCI